MTHATLFNPNQLRQCFTTMPIRAREHQNSAPKRPTYGQTSRVPYRKNCTVNSYNGYITSINISVLHLLSPLCMLKQLCENLHTLEHTATHLFDGLNMAKSHILLNGQFWPAPANRCTDSLVLGIYGNNM